MTPCAFVVGASFFAASAHRARFASQPTLLFGLAEFSLFVAAPRGEAELLLGVAALVLGAATLVRGAMAALVRGAVRLVVGAAALVFGGSSSVGDTTLCWVGDTMLCSPFVADADSTILYSTVQYSTVCTVQYKLVLHMECRKFGRISDNVFVNRSRKCVRVVLIIFREESKSV